MVAARSPLREEPLDTGKGWWSCGGRAREHLETWGKKGSKPVSMGIEDSGPGRAREPGFLSSHFSHSAPFLASAPRAGPPPHCPEMPDSFHEKGIS